ncbi:hypothetical protein ACA040_002550 [Xenophilus aerolatus]
MNGLFLTDAEVDAMCEGLAMNAAKARHLRSMGLVVNVKPNGRPLIVRSHAEAVMSGRAEADAAAQPQEAEPAPAANTAGIVALFGRRRAA